MSILPCLVQAQDFTLKVDVPVVSLDVSVLDPAGQPVDGLNPNDFELLEDGVPQEILYFGSSRSPYSVYLLFDSSGSTRHKWSFMRQAAAGFLEFIKPEDRVSIGIFDQQLHTLSTWDDPRQTTLDALDRLALDSRPSGTTEFYRSLEQAIRQLATGFSERRAIIVLTDGRDTSLYLEFVRRNRVIPPEQDRGFGRVYRAAADAGIPIYFIAVNTDFNLEPNAEGGDEYRNLSVIYRGSAIPAAYLEQVRIRMEQIALVSGGRVQFPGRIEDVSPLFAALGQTLGRAYSIGYSPEIDEADGKLRKIVVKLRNEAYRIVQSRESYSVTRSD